MATFVVLIYFGLTALAASVARGQSHPWRLGRWSPGRGNAINAIYKEFCGAYRYCALGDQAYRVADCETGGTFDTWAGVGKHDYWGLFQMGHRERAQWGYGVDPWHQAAGARRYYNYAHGWGPWECKP